MIFEIGRKDGQLLAPFFEYTEETLVLSYTQGHMGRGWTDDPERLTCAKILTGDFCFLAGDHSAPDAAALVKDIPVDYAIPWILYAPQNEGWNALVEAVWPEHDKYKRYAIRKDTCFDRERLEGFAGALPEEYRLTPIDKELYGWALGVGWARDFVSQFSSAEDFLARGLGYCVMYGGEPVGGASSFTVYSGGIEIQIEVMKEHRRKGLALACASRLILSCLDRNWYPSWDAANLASVALAEKLGYRLSHEYDTYMVVLADQQQI